MITISLDNKWKNKPKKPAYSYQYSGGDSYSNKGWSSSSNVHSQYHSTYDSKGQPQGAMAIFQRVLEMNNKIRQALLQVAYDDSDFVQNPTHNIAEVEEICTQVEKMRFNMPLDQDPGATPFCVLVKYIDGHLKGKLERAIPGYYQFCQTA